MSYPRGKKLFLIARGLNGKKQFKTLLIAVGQNHIYLQIIASI